MTQKKTAAPVTDTAANQRLDFNIPSGAKEALRMPPSIAQANAEGMGWKGRRTQLAWSQRVYRCLAKKAQRTWRKPQSLLVAGMDQGGEL